VLTKQGPDLPGANGIVLSADERVLYVTNRDIVMAFDVRPDGSLANGREFAKLRGGQGGDGSAIDSEGRLYVSTGRSVDVFSPQGEFLGSIPGRRGCTASPSAAATRRPCTASCSTAAGERLPRATASSRLPMLAQGYLGRAK
jgi:sugar lactone lactonase YvrE